MNCFFFLFNKAIHRFLGAEVHGYLKQSFKNHITENIWQLIEKIRPFVIVHIEYCKSNFSSSSLATMNIYKGCKEEKTDSKQIVIRCAKGFCPIHIPRYMTG